MPQTPLVVYESEEAKKFLEGENLLPLSTSQLELPTDAFSPASFNLPVKAPRFHTIDSLSRKSLQCLMIAETLSSHAWEVIKNSGNVTYSYILESISCFFPINTQ